MNLRGLKKVEQMKDREYKNFENSLNKKLVLLNGLPKMEKLYKI